MKKVDIPIPKINIHEVDTDSLIKEAKDILGNKLKYTYSYDDAYLNSLIDINSLWKKAGIGLAKHEYYTYDELRYIYNYFGEKNIYDYFHNIKNGNNYFRIVMIYNDLCEKKKEHYETMSKILDVPVNRDNIATSQEELLKNPNKYVALSNDLILPDVENIYLPNLRYIHGNVRLDSLKDASGLSSLGTVYGNLMLNSLTIARGLENLRYIYGDADFSNLINATGLNNLQVIMENANFKSLIDASGLDKLLLIKFDANFNSLNTSSGLENLRYIGHNAHFESLADASGLHNLKVIKNMAIMDKLIELNNYTGLENLEEVEGGKFDIKKDYRRLYTKNAYIGSFWL